MKGENNEREKKMKKPVEDFSNKKELFSMIESSNERSGLPFSNLMHVFKSSAHKVT